MQLFKKKEQRNVENPQIPISNQDIVQFLGGDGLSITGETVTPETAMKVPAIWAAVNFISSTIASLPLKVYTKTETGRKEAADKTTYLLHDSVNEQMTSHAWREYAMQCVLLTGRSVSYIHRNTSKKITGIYPLEPQKTKIKLRSGQILYEYSGEPKVTYQASDVIDIIFSPAPLKINGALNPLTQLEDSIGLSLALQKYAANFFRNGGVPPLVLQGPAMSPAAAERASDDVKQAIKRAAQTGDKAFVIPEGYELKPIGTNPEDSQLEESRRFQIEETARVYGLPPAFLQDLTRATFSNAEQQGLQLVKYLTNWLDKWEKELNHKLFPSTRDKYVEFNLDGLLRGDFKTRMDGYAQGIQNSMMTPNEVRKLENREPIEGGDKLFIQQNMSDVKELNDASD